MSENSSGSLTAVVAVIAIVVIAAVAFYAVQMMTGEKKATGVQLNLGETTTNR